MWGVAAAVALSIATAGPVPAAPHADSTGASVEVKGRAPRGTVVELRARCELGPCVGTAVAGRRGRWAGVLDLVLPFGRRSVRVRAVTTNRTVSRRLALTYPDYAAVSPYADLARVPQLTMIGDSLSVGTDAALRAALPGWRVTTNGRVGRPLAEGMAVLDATPLPRGPRALAFSLFTNDDPRGAPALDAAVRTSVERLGPRDCAIWATIVRPKVGGRSYAGPNATLQALEDEHAGRLVLVDWAAAVKRHPAWLTRDKVHPNATGYAARARLYARAAQRCATEQGWVASTS